MFFQILYTLQFSFMILDMAGLQEPLLGLEVRSRQTEAPAWFLCWAWFYFEVKSLLL